MILDESNGSHANGRGRRGGRACRSLATLVARATVSRELHGSRSLAELVHRGATKRLERRLATGVVLLANVNEEQALLEQLASVVEGNTPISPALFATVERLVAETTPPSLGTSIAELRRTLSTEGFDHRPTRGNP